MKRIHAFDFDGTLTTRDTLLAFVGFVAGRRALLGELLYLSPLLVLMKLGFYSNHRVKERFFSHFFKGMDIGVFERLCQQFATNNQHLLRPAGMETVKQALGTGDTVLIISASIDNWVKPFFGDQKVKVVGTQVELNEGKLTGRFLSENCYGQEKVRRLTALFPLRSEYHLVAYGDCRGDKQLLAFADEAHYKPFR